MRHKVIEIYNLDNFSQIKKTHELQATKSGATINDGEWFLFPFQIFKKKMELYLSKIYMAACISSTLRFNSVLVLTHLPDSAFKIFTLKSKQRDQNQKKNVKNKLTLHWTHQHVVSAFASQWYFFQIHQHLNMPNIKTKPHECQSPNHWTRYFQHW